jgi:hypothetical protein
LKEIKGPLDVYTTLMDQQLHSHLIRANEFKCSQQRVFLEQQSMIQLEMNSFVISTFDKLYENYCEQLEKVWKWETVIFLERRAEVTEMMLKCRKKVRGSIANTTDWNDLLRTHKEMEDCITKLGLTITEKFHHIMRDFLGYLYFFTIQAMEYIHHHIDLEFSMAPKSTLEPLDLRRVPLEGIQTMEGIAEFT